MPYWQPPGFFRWKLGTLLLDPTRLSSARLREFENMNNWRGRLREAELRTGAYTSGDTRAILRRVRVPTLIQWSTHSTYLAATEAEVFQAWMPHAPTEVILYPQAGHLMVLDAPDATGRDARAFLDRTVGV